MDSVSEYATAVTVLEGCQPAQASITSVAWILGSYRPEDEKVRRLSVRDAAELSFMNLSN